MMSFYHVVKCFLIIVALSQSVQAPGRKTTKRQTTKPPTTKLRRLTTRTIKTTVPPTTKPLKLVTQKTTVPPMLINVSEGQQLVLTCKIPTRFMLLRIRWLKINANSVQSQIGVINVAGVVSGLSRYAQTRNIRITLDEKRRNLSSSIVVDDVRYPRDGGMYKCVILAGVVSVSRRKQVYFDVNVLRRRTNRPARTTQTTPVAPSSPTNPRTGTVMSRVTSPSPTLDTNSMSPNVTTTPSPLTSKGSDTKMNHWVVAGVVIGILAVVFTGVVAFVCLRMNGKIPPCRKTYPRTASLDHSVTLDEDDDTTYEYIRNVYEEPEKLVVGRKDSKDSNKQYFDSNMDYVEPNTQYMDLNAIKMHNNSNIHPENNNYNGHNDANVQYYNQNYPQNDDHDKSTYDSQKANNTHIVLDGDYIEFSDA